MRFTLLSSLIVYLFVGTTYADQQTYTVGVVPQFGSHRIVETWQPILESISENSGIHLQLKTSPNIPEFEKQFEAGEFDFAYMNPYHLIVANEKNGYLPLVRDIGRSLFGIIVVKNSSPLKSVKELSGKTVAFPSPNALGAALIPRAEFSKKFHIKVKELYVKSHNSVYLNVLLGHTDAGGGVQKTLEQQSEDIQSQLRILYKTKEVPSHPFVTHPRINKKVRDKITSALLELGNSEPGKELLAKVPIKEIGKTSIKDYGALKHMGLAEFYIKK
jgi:phosphonate transport system substrate-binding protein